MENFEQMVAALVAHGYTLVELAERLGCSPKTLNRYRQRQTRIPKLTSETVENLLVDTITTKGKKHETAS